MFINQIYTENRSSIGYGFTQNRAKVRLYKSEKSAGKIEKLEMLRSWKVRNGKNDISK